MSIQDYVDFARAFAGIAKAYRRLDRRRPRARRVSHGRRPGRRRDPGRQRHGEASDRTRCASTATCTAAVRADVHGGDLQARGEGQGGRRCRGRQGPGRGRERAARRLLVRRARLRPAGLARRGLRDDPRRAGRRRGRHRQALSQGQRLEFQRRSRRPRLLAALPVVQPDGSVAPRGAADARSRRRSISG